MLTGFKVPRRIYAPVGLPKNATGKLDRDEIARILRAIASGLGARNPRRSRKCHGRCSSSKSPGCGRDAGPRSRRNRSGRRFLPARRRFAPGYELFARLRERYGISVGLGHLFDDAATVAGMARLVERNSVGSSTRTRAMGRLVPIKEAGAVRPVRSARQRRQSRGLHSSWASARTLTAADRHRIAWNRRLVVTAFARRGHRRGQPRGYSRSYSPPDRIFFPARATARALRTRWHGNSKRQANAWGCADAGSLVAVPSRRWTAAARARSASANDTDGDRRRFVLDRILMHASTLARLKGAERSGVHPRKVGRPARHHPAEGSFPRRPQRDTINAWSMRRTARRANAMCRVRLAARSWCA